jgi:hypothetical protein
MTESSMLPSDDTQLCRRAIGQLVAEDPEFIVSMLDEWTADAHAEGDIRAADALLDLRPYLAPQHAGSG